jgi:aminoglycoside phosphotransferase (APT) family kinase protein
MRDTAPVRPGEELDIAALQSYLRGVIPGVDDGIEITQFPGGHSNLTYLLRVGRQGDGERQQAGGRGPQGEGERQRAGGRGPREFVLRRGPLGPVPPKAHDMAREYAVLTRLAPRYAPAPRPVHLCRDTAVIGAVFYLMERRSGVVLRDTLPPTYAAMPAYGARISRTLVDGLADLHRIDIVDSELIGIGRPEGFLERQVEGWASRWERARTTEYPAIEQAISHLRSIRPVSPAPAVVHNDYKLDNVMLDAGDPDKLVAVLDWEMSTVGDPLVDVGLSLVYWQQLSYPPDAITELGAPGAGRGWFTREQFLQRYADRSGRDVSGIAWYEMLSIFKLAVILQQIYHRYVHGQTRDERFRHLDRRVATLAHAAAERMTS